LLVEEHSMKAQTAQTDLQERREIPSALGRMDRALGDLFESIDSLATRLGPVLNADNTVDSETSVPRAALSTDVGRSVDAGALAVEDAASKLRALRDRVEL
jgi:hypothetical protein